MADRDAIADPVIRRAVASLLATGVVDGLYLAGSHGTGQADAFSDIDLVAVAAPDAHGAVADAWQTALAAEVEVVHWDRQSRWGTLVNAITVAWTRVDLFVVQDLRGRAQDALRPVHDRDGLWADLPPKTGAKHPDPAQITRTATEAIRILGLLPLGIGRQEWVTLYWGLSLLRTMIVDLSIQEAAHPHRGGALHLRRQVSDAVHDRLAHLPQGGPSRPAMEAAFHAHAAELLPLARRLAGATGATWPTRFEEVTRAVLADRLGFQMPPAQPGPSPETLVTHN